MWDVLAGDVFCSLEDAMTPSQEVDYILNDCFFAVGQAVGTSKTLDLEVISWWRARYRAFFLHAITANGNSWLKDRDRVTAVGRFLGQRALHHANDRPSIDLHCAAVASREVETGCRMRAAREGAAALASAERE
jgi:hypothetical protein